MTAPSFQPPTDPPGSGAIAAAAFDTLGRPAVWPIALLGFLVRGGLLLVLLPVLVLPTTSDLTILVAPTLTPLVFGEPSPGLVALGAGLALACLVALVAGGAIGTWADLAVIRAAMSETGEGRIAGVTDRRLLLRALAARLVAHVPLAVALAWGAARVVDATYRELVLPGDITNPLGLRVLADVPDAIVLIAVIWLAGETVGGLAVRRLATSDASILRSIGWSIARFAVRPVGTLSTLVATTLAVVLALAVAVVGPAVAWSELRILLAAGDKPIEAAFTVVAFVAAWLAGLLLVSAATTFRSLGWTFEALAAAPSSSAAAPFGRRRHGTIGGGDDGRPGEWSGSGASGRL